MNRRICLLVVLFLVVISTDNGHTHGGGLDRYGCHHDRIRGGYHCHRATTPPPTTSQESTSSEKPLVVNAGLDQFPQPGVIVILSGTAGVPRDAILNYAWTQTSGPSVSLVGANSAITSFVTPETAGETLIFQFTVVDSKGVIQSDDVRVTVIEDDESFVSLGADDEYTCQGITRTEEDFNDCLCDEIGGEREVRHDFPYGNDLESFVFVDCETEYYVIEGGLDKRSSLDSLQQALFFGALTDKIPVVVIYDTDDAMGPYEYRIRAACTEARVLFLHLRLVEGRLTVF